MRKSFSSKKGNHPYAFHLNASDIAKKLGVSGKARYLVWPIEVRFRNTALPRKPYERRSGSPEISTISNKDAAMKRRYFFRLQSAASIASVSSIMASAVDLSFTNKFFLASTLIFVDFGVILLSSI